MALWRNNNQDNVDDTMKQRIGMGTIGGDHAVPAGITGRSINAIIDDSDSRILYGLSTTGPYPGPASFTLFSGPGFLKSGTATEINTEGGAAQLRFFGTSIGILAGTNPYGGNLNVYIDGQLAEGRQLVFTTPLFPGTIGVPAIAATDTTINVVATGSFPASGKLLIDREIISYTSLASGAFMGCTRGIDGTLAADHQFASTIYYWGTNPTTYAVDAGLKRLVFYNPFLDPKEHTVTLVARVNATNSRPNIYFDGFVTGSLLGAQHVYTQTGTIRVTTTTSANGHANIGYISLNSTDISIIGIVGYTQITPTTETDNTTTMAKLGVRASVPGDSGIEGVPYLYVHNGPASTSITLLLTVAYLGESV